jgi:hypothetical protein
MKLKKEGKIMRFKKRKESSTELYVAGIACILVGIFFCLTIIGIIPGFMFMMFGLISILKGGKAQQKEKSERQAMEAENVEKTRKAIADGIAEGLRKAKEAELTSITISTEETNIK